MLRTILTIAAEISSIVIGATLLGLTVWSLVGDPVRTIRLRSFNRAVKKAGIKRLEVGMEDIADYPPAGALTVGDLTIRNFGSGYIVSNKNGLIVDFDSNLFDVLFDALGKQLEDEE